MTALPQENRYTLADALAWDEDDRIELIYGYPMMMAPPVRAHQKVSKAIFRQLDHYLEGKNAKSIMSPLPSVPSRRRETSRRMWIRWWSRTSP